MSDEPTEEALKARVAAFTADLTARTGVDLDPEEVWEEVQSRIAKDNQ